MKRCGKCKELKSLEDFYKNKNESFGVDTRCKVCRQVDDGKRSKKYYQINKKKLLIKSKIYRSTEKGKIIDSNNTNRRRSIYKQTDITSKWLLNFKKEASNCELCNCILNEIYKDPQSKNLDHIIPLNLKGTHTMNNVRYICQSCNLKRPKNGRDLENAK